MNDEFEIYFRFKLREDFGELEDVTFFSRRGFTGYRTREVLKAFATSRIRTDSTMNWRDDARYYLLKNIEFMVIDPAFLAGPRDEFELFDELSDLLRLDIKRLVEVAENISEERERDYVSSTSVAKAIGQEVDQLKTSAFQIWGE